MPENTTQPELVNGDLSGLPWAAIILTAEEAKRREAAGEIEWSPKDECYRFVRDRAGIPVKWLAWIGRRLAQVRNVTDLEYRILAALIWRSGAKGAAWPSIRTIAEDCQTTATRSIRESINHLEELGYLQIDRGGAHQSNKYRVTVPEIEAEKSVGVVPGTTQRSPEDYRTNKGTNKSLEEGAETFQADLFQNDGPIEKKPEQLFVHLLPDQIRRSIPAMQALGEFAQHRKEMKKPLTHMAVRRLCSKIETWTPEQVAEAAGAAIVNGWRDLFLPKQAAAGQTAKPAAKQPDYTGAW